MSDLMMARRGRAAAAATVLAGLAGAGVRRPHAFTGAVI
jgi:hypothetical protein